MADAAKAAREALLEAAVEMDDALMEKYLDEGEGAVSEADLARTLKMAIVSRRVMPVLTGSATANVGVPQMLDFVADYFPSPVDVGSVEAYEGEKAVEVKPNLDDPLYVCFLERGFLRTVFTNGSQ